MSDESAEFLAAYDDHRVRNQMAFYEARIGEYSRSARQTARAVSLLVAGAAACGALGALFAEQNRWLGLVAAGLSAVAAAIAAWSDVIGFSVNSDLYQAALGGLRRLRVDRPSVDDADDAQVAGYMVRVEDVLLGEVRSWSERWAQTSSEAAADGPAPPDDVAT